MKRDSASRLNFWKLILPLIAAIMSTLVATYSAYQNYIGAVELPIRATQTAEYLRTEFAPTTTVTTFPQASKTPTLTPSPTTSSNLTSTPFPPNLETQVVILQNQISTLESITTQQASNHNYESEIKTISGTQQAIDSRLSTIEKVILDNPEKSLELTFMRKEISDLKTSYQADTERTLNEIERVYNQNNSFLILVFTIIIGMIAPIIGNYFGLGNLIKKPENQIVEKEKTKSEVQAQSENNSSTGKETNSRKNPK